MKRVSKERFAPILHFFIYYKRICSVLGLWQYYLPTSIIWGSQKKHKETFSKTKTAIYRSTAFTYIDHVTKVQTL
jgi:hypothetical protein